MAASVYLRPLSNFLSLKTGLGLFVLLFLTPDGRLQNQRVRYIYKPLLISTAKSTPPRHAFEEVLRLTSEDSAQAAAAPIVRPSLNASLVDGPRVPVAQIFNRRVHLNPMIFTRGEALQERAGRRTDEPNIESNNFVLPSRGLAARSPEATFAETRGEERAAQDWFASLSPRQQRILEASGMDHAAALDEAPLPNLKMALQEKVEEELAAMGLPATSTRSPPKMTAGGSVTPESRPVVTGRFVVAGHIYLDEKTPLLPNHHIEVHWMREGVAKKTQVMPQTQSAFNLDVTELAGQVRAEMYNDGTGQVVAAGSLRLSPALPAEALKNTQLRLQPTRSVVARYADFYRQSSALMTGHSKDKKQSSKPRGQIMAKASFDELTEFAPDQDGTLFIDGVSPQSSSFALTESKDYYPAIHMLTASRGEDALPLLPVKTATALLEIVEEQLGYTSAQKNGAIILGQVIGEGRPLSGAKVSLENADGLRPIYLNEILIPDPQLEETTSTGYFILVHPPEGFYSLRAERSGRFIGFGNVTAEAKTSSFVVIEHSAVKAPFEMRSFNAFSGEGVSSQISLQANDQIFEIESYGMVEHPLVGGQALAQVEPHNPEFLRALYPYDGKDDHLYMPILKKSWLENILNRHRINAEPHSGLIVGFTRKGGFEISLPHLSESAQVRVVYFDAQGEETPAPVDQGGFILVNVPDQAQTIVLSDALGNVLSQVMPVDAGWVTSARFDL